MRKIVYGLLLLLAAVGCKERYNPPAVSPPTGYLVVEGIINSGDSATTIMLSRTNQLSDESKITETGASVYVEGDDNSSYGLLDNNDGSYQAGPLGLNSNQKYRLRIHTKDGKEYLSDFAAVKTTPPIDSISWQGINNGVQIYASSHDLTNNTRYYKWAYEETWEFHSPFTQGLRYDTISGPLPNYVIIIAENSPDPTEFACWQFRSSTSLLLGSSAKLSQDVIYNAPLVFLPNGGIQLSVKYSILVKQYALTADAYAFLQKIQKNTEETGSLFDPQPSELVGNIHCTTNPAEPVIGFVSVTTEETKRIFIDRSQVPFWRYMSSCMEDTVKNTDENVRRADGSGLLPTRVSEGTLIDIKAFLVVPAYCIECTLTGTNHKPPYWP